MVLAAILTLSIQPSSMTVGLDVVFARLPIQYGVENSKYIGLFRLNPADKSLSSGYNVLVGVHFIRWIAICPLDI